MKLPKNTSSPMFDLLQRNYHIGENTWYFIKIMQKCDDKNLNISKRKACPIQCFRFEYEYTTHNN